MSAQAVAERQDNEPANVEQHPASDTASLLQVITRAASDPNVDIDKMERLMQMHERLIERSARVEFASAFAEMQTELPVIDRRGRIIVRKKDASGDRTGDVQQDTPYALWEDINDAIKPVMHKHGFGLSFRVGQTPEGKVTVTGVLSHRGGHSEETTMTLMQDSSGSKNAVQAIGSSVSYGKRYAASALLNLTSRGEDDDGKVAGADRAINDQQRAELDALLLLKKADIDRFLSFFKVEFLAELPAARFAEAKAMLEAKGK